jgi:hypothetical protein
VSGEDEGERAGQLLDRLRRLGIPVLIRCASSSTTSSAFAARTRSRSRSASS